MAPNVIELVQQQNLLTPGAEAEFNRGTRIYGANMSEKAREMTALAAKFEAFDNSWATLGLQALAMLLALTTALLPSLTLTGNLLLRYP